MLKLTDEMKKGLKKVEVTALEASLKELPAIVAATVAVAGGFLHTSPAVHGPLVKAGLVEIAPADAFDGAVTPEGNVATKATEAGIAFVNAAGATDSGAAAGAEEVKREKISFETGVAMPEVIAKRGGGVGRESIYPFNDMPVNASFFVGATAKMPEPWNSLQSAVANAEKKFAKVKTILLNNEDGTPMLDAEGKQVEKTVMKQVKSREKGKEGQIVERPELIKTRTFKIFQVEENGVKGARIWRTA